MGSLKVFDSDSLPDKELISTGLRSLDAAGVYLPVPGLVEIFGLPGSGKTLLSMLFKPEIFIDVENSLTGTWLRLWSPDTKVVKGYEWSEVKDFLERVVDKVRLVVVDSVASLDFEDERPGSMSRNLGGWVVKWAPRLTNTCIVLVNHVRFEFTGSYYPAMSSPGGMGIKHAADLRLKVKKGDYKSRVWHESLVEVVKSKVGRSGGSGSVFFNLKTGEVSDQRPTRGKGVDDEEV